MAEEVAAVPDVDHYGARALIAAAATVLRGQLGDREMAVAVGEVVREVLKATRASNGSGLAEPVPEKDSPAQPEGAPCRMDIKDRVEVMLGFLRACDSAEGQHAALASILASAAFLRERRGENYAVGVLHQAEAITSRAAALDRWQPERGVVQ